MSSLYVKIQPSSTPPSDRFWWGVLVVLVRLVVTGVKLSQFLVLRHSLEFDNTFLVFTSNCIQLMIVVTILYNFMNFFAVTGL